MTAPIVQMDDRKPRTPFNEEFDGDFQTSFWQSHSDRSCAILWDLIAEGKRRDE